MNNLRFKTLFFGILLTVMTGIEAFAQPPESRVPEACDSATFKPQSAVTDRELLARVEQRSEALWAKLFEIQMQEIDLQARLDDLDYRLTPDGIRQALAFVGSVRPMDELRESLRIRLEGERVRISGLMEQLELSRQRLEDSIRRTDAELERLRQRLSSAE
ncbi:MAG TPA: hypothetical protein VKN18_25460 [Blastocatellia bacterium]|nr:hypothetical protein [Blastocatellia bacterium]